MWLPFRRLALASVNSCLRVPIKSNKAMWLHMGAQLVQLQQRLLLPAWRSFEINNAFWSSIGLHTVWLADVVSIWELSVFSHEHRNILTGSLWVGLGMPWKWWMMWMVKDDLPLFVPTLDRSILKTGNRSHVQAGTECDEFCDLVCIGCKNMCFARELGNFLNALRWHYTAWWEGCSSFEMIWQCTPEQHSSMETQLISPHWRKVHRTE